jgi:NAD(P)-dependent dehydrogenase (short-subunit alcohol dehydrogenase family)
MAARLAGKVAIVTGSTRGLGRAIALRFAGEGAAVVVTGRDPVNGAAVVDRIAAAGGVARFIPADVTVEAQVEGLVTKTVDAFGKLTTLVNNAALTTPPLGDAPLANLRNETLALAFEANMRSVVWATRYALPHLVAANGGAIVNLSSLVAQVSSANAVAYGMSKAAIDNLTRSTALAYAKDGVRVNAVSPGVIAGGDNWDELSSRPAFRKNFIEPIPLPYVGTPDDVAAACLFLASDEARFITNTILPVNGGIHV